jgi:hypothetical protein
MKVNDGTMVGFPSPLTPTAGWIPGINGFPAVVTDGNDQIECGSSTTLDPTAVTLAVWCNPLYYPSNFGYFAGKEEVSSPYLGYIIRVHGTDLDWFIGTSTTFYSFTSSFGAPAYNTWVHLVLTYDGETLNAYKNGIFVGTNTSPSGNLRACSAGTKFVIGSSYADLVGRRIDAMFGSVSVHNRALSDVEVFNQYQETLLGFPNLLRRYTSRSWFAMGATGAAPGSPGVFNASWAAGANVFMTGGR